MWIIPEGTIERGSPVEGGSVRRLERTLCLAKIPGEPEKMAGCEREGWGHTKKRVRLDLFSTPGMRCKPGGKPEGREAPGMAESPSRTGCGQG